MKRAKTWLPIFLLPTLALAAVAQPKSAPAQNPDDGAQTIQQWMQDNLDGDALDLLSDIDQDRVRDFFDKLEQRFDGTNIYELGSLKDVAVRILPVLQQFDETQPYAAWLRAHLDDLDAAGKMQQQMKAAYSKTQPAAIPPGPVLKIERSIWVKELENQSWPPLAKTYVPKLKQVFISEKVPPALVWVAGVESSFDPRARSPAGAAGMFQLMPATARKEHLSLWPFDQRYQLDKSAHAAARYLRALHTRYGDWQLALAAYNVGAGRVDKLLKEHKAHSFDAIARWLPAETQLYVPKVEATVFRREGLALADLPAPPG